MTQFPLGVVPVYRLRRKRRAANRCPGSTHPPGDRIWAMLSPSVPVFTQPTYSSISFGLFPAAVTRVGLAISSGILHSAKNDIVSRPEISNVFRHRAFPHRTLSSSKTKSG